MSVYTVNKFLYRLELEREFLDLVRRDPAHALANSDLAADERELLLAGDVGTLYLRGVHPFLMNALVRFKLLGLDPVTYLQRVRAAVAGQTEGATP